MSRAHASTPIILPLVLMPGAGASLCDTALTGSPWPALLEAASMAVARFDIQGHCLEHNRLWLSWTASPSGSAHPMIQQAALHARWWWRAQRAWRRKGILDRRIRHPLPGGEPAWLRVMAMPEGPVHAPTGSVWLLQDDSHAQDLAQALERSSRERDVLLDNSLVGMAYVMNRTLVWGNRALTQMLRTPLETLIGRSPLSSLAPHPPADTQSQEAAAWQALASADHFRAECRLARAGLPDRWLEVLARCVHPRQPENGSIWTFLDVTERRQQQQAMAEALTQQQELNALKSAIVSVTSHQFRTPLATILSSAELVRHYRDQLAPPEQEQLLAQIDHAVTQLTRMLDRLLVIGKADARMLDCVPHEVHLDRWLHELAAQLAAQLGCAPDRLVVDCTADTPPCQIDPMLVRWMLEPLVENALRYADPSQPVTIRARPGALGDRGEGHWIEVCDRGVGIPAQALAQLLHDSQAGRHAPAPPGSAGLQLGLAIVQRLVRLHHGEFLLESTPGQGTCAKLWLPDHPTAHLTPPSEVRHEDPGRG